MTLALTVTPNPVPSGGTTVTVDGTGGEERRTRILLEGVVQGDEFYSTGGAFSKVISVSATVTTQHIVVEQCVAGTFVPKATATITIEDVPPGDTPFADMTGWRLVFQDEFDRTIAEGDFLNGANYAVAGTPDAVTADKRYGVWKEGWKSTPPYYIGRSDPSIISVHDSMLDIHLQTRDGFPRFAVVTPLPSGSSPMGGLLGMRRHMKVMADSMAGWKAAMLLWSDSAKTNDDLKYYGEIDGPESSFNQPTHGFMHRVLASSLSDQDTFIPSPDTVMWQDWHDYVIEYLPSTPTYSGTTVTSVTGGSVKQFVDGVQIGSTITSRVPWTPFHANIQTEPNLSYTPPAVGVSGHVYVDRLAIWVPA